MDRLLQNNVVVRILSLVVALALWLVIVNEEDPEMARTFAVEPAIRQVPEGLEPLEWTDQVTVRLQGRRSDIYQVEAGDLDFFADLTDGEPGENWRRVRHQDLPEGLRVAEMQPEELRVVLDEKAELELPVTLQMEGRPAPGYQRGEAVAEPENVKITGPSTLVDEVDRARVRVDVAGATGDLDVPAEVEVLDRRGNPVDRRVRMQPGVVRVRVPVEEMPAEEFPVEARLLGAPPEGHVISDVRVRPAAVMVYAPARVLEETETVFTHAVDVSGVREDIRREVRLRAPPGADLLVDRVWVTVRIIPAEAERTIPGVEVEVDNLEPGLEARMDPDAVTVRVTGPEDLVQDLTPGDLQARVDLSGLGPGQHEVSVGAAAPGKLLVLQINPDTVVVTISAGG